MAEFPNVFSTSAVLNNASTASSTKSFGFIAARVFLHNPLAISVFVNPAGAAATTAMAFLSTGESMTIDRQMSGIGLTTTSTTAGGQTVSVLAVG